MSDNLHIWNQVCETNPSDTKEVSFGRKFTAIDAHSQVKKATEVFGPIGSGWGYGVELIWDQEGVIIARVSVWYMEGDKESMPIVQCGAAELTPNTKKGPKIDTDATKKAITDGLTKCLSLLGFNADVFHGKFDDNKYVAAMRQKEAGAKKPPTPQPPIDNGPPDPAMIDAESAITGCQSIDELGRVWKGLSGPQKKALMNVKNTVKERLAA